MLQPQISRPLMHRYRRAMYFRRRRIVSFMLGEIIRQYWNADSSATRCHRRHARIYFAATMPSPAAAAADFSRRSLHAHIAGAAARDDNTADDEQSNIIAFTLPPQPPRNYIRAASSALSANSR